MTIAFLASCEDHRIPRPEMVLLLMSVVLVPLMGKLCREIAVPLIFVDLVPRVGGLGTIFFSGMHWIKLRLEALKHARKPFPLLMRTGAWGQHPLALGPSRDIPSSFA